MKQVKENRVVKEKKTKEPSTTSKVEWVLPEVTQEYHKELETKSNPNCKVLSNKQDLSLVPALCQEILSIPLTIGIEKGYKRHSWLTRGTPRSVWIAAAERHRIAYERGEGWYSELDKKGDPCPSLSHHLYAFAFNAMAAAISHYLNRHEEDDRIPL